MKVIGVKNDHIKVGIRMQTNIELNDSTKDLTVTHVTINDLIEDTASPLYRIEDSYVVNLNDLRSRIDWIDHQVYFLATDNRKFIPLFSLYQETLTQRETASEYAARLKRNLIVGINVPFYHSTDDELFITVNFNPDAIDSDFTVSSNLEKIWSEAGSSGTERVLRMPHIRAVAPASMAPDSMETVEVRIEDASGNLIEKNAIVYVEAISGFGGGTRVAITNGIGYLPVMSSGMQSGSIVRMKLGWKYYVGVEDAIIQVV